MTLRLVKFEAAQAYLQSLLTKHEGCVARVALEAGVARTEIYKLFRRYNIKIPHREGRGNKSWYELNDGRYRRSFLLSTVSVELAPLVVSMQHGRFRRGEQWASPH